MFEENNKQNILFFKKNMFATTTSQEIELFQLNKEKNHNKVISFLIDLKNICTMSAAEG